MCVSVIRSPNQVPKEHAWLPSDDLQCKVWVNQGALRASRI